MLSLTSLSSSVFVFHNLTTHVNTVEPPVLLNVFESPLLPFSLSNVSANTVFWSDFEESSQQWSSRGGSWTPVPNGYKGRGVYGVDYGDGIGGASQYYLLNSLSSYSRLYVSVKLRNLVSSGLIGLVFLNDRLSRMYEVSINISESTASLQVRSYRVETPNQWFTLNSSNLFPYTAQWYTLIVYYENKLTSVYFNIQVYAENGTLITSLEAVSTSSRRFQVRHVGLELENAEGVFDDFIISVRNPSSITITGLQPKTGLQVYDNEGWLVGVGFSVGDSTTITVVTDIVVGTGDGGVLKLQTAYGAILLNTSIPLLGGETYSVMSGKAFEGSTDPTRTASHINIYTAGIDLNISIVEVENTDPGEYEVRLLLAHFDANGSSSFKIIVASSSNISTPISVENNTVLSRDTSPIRLSSEKLSLVLLTSTPNPDYTVILTLEYCSLQRSVCISYPITITSNRGGIK